MPKKVEAYLCEFCDFGPQSLNGTIEHEKRCIYNPNRVRASCNVCVHKKKIPITSYDRFGRERAKVAYGCKLDIKRGHADECIYEYCEKYEREKDE